MSLQRLTRYQSLLRTQIQASTTQLTSSRGVKWAATDTATTSADGASEKTTDDAQPTILNRSPPEGEEKSKETQKHNEEQAQRHDKPDAKDKDGKGDDKVSKDFWKGQGGSS